MNVKGVTTCPFLFDYVPDWYKTQEMFDKAVDVFLPKLKLVPNWLSQVKWLKNLMMLYSLMISLSMKILIMSHFVAVKYS